MSKKMLIDATHSEETRVAVVENDLLVELDVDTSTKQQFKGNIYLAKIVRVEPSLQAAFVEYGGNRHGFLAFGEIHPDYYQIPVADKEALKELLEKKEQAEESENPLEESGKTDCGVSDDIRQPRNQFFRRYKIQDVIHQNQILLVQVVKEERGNKGAALTTYLSLAGRYSVLMPNNGTGGGISKKISNPKTRKTMRDIVAKLPIPKGMSVIIRTAGQERKPSEIKRDYEYLIKTWNLVREKTLQSIAPTLIHQEGDIIKRCLRDVYTNDIEEICVSGVDVFKTTRDFVKKLMPNQLKKVTQYKEITPLFLKYGVEKQINGMYNNVAQLKSGGYLVIDQTEALVAIDVNSGRSIRERDLEETALRTNLEACAEVARQLRLRDLAGLIVIDFIDMNDPKNNAAIERALKEALRSDRARVQIGKMSGFGLMEMSRQRLHSSVLESSYVSCPHCQGKGRIRSVESYAMNVLHQLEERGLKASAQVITISVPITVAFYLLNVKRLYLNELENKYTIQIKINGDEKANLLGDAEIHSVPMIVSQKKEEDKFSFSNLLGLKKKEPKKKKEAPVKEEEKKEEPVTEVVAQVPATQKAEKKSHARKRHRKSTSKQAGEEQFKVVEQKQLAVYNARTELQTISPNPVVVLEQNKEEKDRPKKKGWWTRIIG